MAWVLGVSRAEIGSTICGLEDWICGEGVASQWCYSVGRHRVIQSVLRSFISWVLVTATLCVSFSLEHDSEEEPWSCRTIGSTGGSPTIWDL